jgi:hypothetical protein
MMSLTMHSGIDSHLNGSLSTSMVVLWVNIIQDYIAARARVAMAEAERSAMALGKLTTSDVRNQRLRRETVQ